MEIAGQQGTSPASVCIDFQNAQVLLAPTAVQAGETLLTCCTELSQLVEAMLQQAADSEALLAQQADLALRERVQAMVTQGTGHSAGLKGLQRAKGVEGFSDLTSKEHIESAHNLQRLLAEQDALRSSLEALNSQLAHIIS